MQEKIEMLKRFISRFNRVIIAFSGGVDSATLSAFCKDIVEVLAVTVRSKTNPSREIEKAIRISKEIGIKHRFLDVDIFQVENFAENSELRCYYCKKFIIKKLENLAIKENYDAIFEGTNASDLLSYRPGYRAVLECKIAFSPWAKFGITKEEVRSLARSMGLSFYNDPPLSCLATRIPYGSKITPEKLEMIDLAENFVIKFAGVENVRVRCIEDFAVIEVEKDEVRKVLDKREIIKNSLLKTGFKKIFVNPEGYRMGVIARNFENFIEL
ncbi:MAG: ATP-dependent sacrificial sulfur transferase LarE [Archaeoglobaceae archaeon]|nr:ATP-dependent sacrificial sulfur transferase LarE [Archaeoglobaceae archaeon]MCX8151983.1 ATP-dependent sacrificial sulfur transferase LarE [Archaeoglobaceae archaeon]MDW8013372.1 ATP-dependent sacrificial sulfur transferase LarE [Archaeoglobaceae archaeon]